MTADLSETRRRLDDLIRFAGEVHEAASAARDAMDANKPFIVPQPIDLTGRLAPYHAATEDVPRDVVCAVLDALARCDLSMVKPLLGELRTTLTLRFDPTEFDHDEYEVWSLHTRLCDLIAAESAWPQQPARTRERIYGGRATE